MSSDILFLFCNFEMITKFIIGYFGSISMYYDIIFFPHICNIVIVFLQVFKIYGRAPDFHFSAL